MYKLVKYYSRNKIKCRIINQDKSATDFRIPKYTNFIEEYDNFICGNIDFYMNKLISARTKCRLGYTVDSSVEITFGQFFSRDELNIAKIFGAPSDYIMYLSTHMDYRGLARRLDGGWDMVNSKTQVYLTYKQFIESRK